MDLCFPGVAHFDFKHRTHLFEVDDFQLPIMENARINPEKSKDYKPIVCTSPNIFGMGERSRPNTWRQLVISVSHRNFAASEINSKVSVTQNAEILVGSFFKICNKAKLAECFDPIQPDLNKIDMWLISRDGRKYINVLNNLDMEPWTDKLNRLKIMIKGTMKPKLDVSHYQKYAQPANIVYYENVINMYFSPIFLEIFGRIKYCLSDKVIIYCGMNFDELGELVKSKLTRPLSSYYSTEIDFSKFDKSQGQIIKLYEEVIYKCFKFDGNVYDNFKATEYFVNARGASGVNVDLFCQRRTGSPNTFLSNTIATLAMISSVYDLDDIDLMMVAGDDSLILSKTKLPNRCSELNSRYGMEAKFMEHPVPYFCSKFLIDFDGKINILPDAIRFFSKLSVPVMKTELYSGVMRERFTSYRDLMSAYFYEYNLTLVGEYSALKYNIPVGSDYAALATIHCMLSSFKNFIKVYEDGYECLI